MTMSDQLNHGRSMAEECRRLATPLRDIADLDRLIDNVKGNRFVCLGEASHGTHEYYRWRGDISRRLIEEGGFSWIGVEGDWPDCWKIDRWVRGLDHQELSAIGLLGGFTRWPTWMWANHEVADFLEWLRTWNQLRHPAERVGFYGLDVYSLWDSLREVMRWLEIYEPSALPAAKAAWMCFIPFKEDPHRYAWNTRLVPETCEADVVYLLAEVRRRSWEHLNNGDDAFTAIQNAEIAVGAEQYYRTMVRGDRQSWNIRDRHMVGTIDRISHYLGPRSKGLIWAHNTHIGDARATDMARDGLVNVGQLVRERHGDEGVSLIGFAGHRGTVLAAESWGTPEETFSLPPAIPGSHEDLLHKTLESPSLLMFGEARGGPWLSTQLGHRAVGVVYDPRMEAGNYVPTTMGGRYDALLWFEQTAALTPLHHERPPVEPEYETEPSGF